MSQKTIVIHCSAHNGYRRAGIAFAKGKNEFAATEFTDAQLQAINADPRLVIEDPISSGETSPVAQTKTVKKAPAKAQAVTTEQGA